MFVCHNGVYKLSWQLILNQTDVSNMNQNEGDGAKVITNNDDEYCVSFNMVSDKEQ